MRATVLGALFMVAACGPPPPLITHPAALRYPPAPATARVAYVGQLRGHGPESPAVSALIGGEAPRLLIGPISVTVSPAGTLVVADPGASTVHLFDLDRRTHVGVLGGLDGRWKLPVGVAADAQSRIYVSDGAAGSVEVLTAAGEGLRRIADDLERPTGLVCDRGRGVLYVADTARHRIQARRVPNGELIWSVGTRGGGLGQFNFPTFLAFSRTTDEVLVSDTLNFRIQRLDIRGRPVGAFGKLGDATGALARPKGVAVDSEGHIYVVDGLFGVVQVFDASGRLLMYFGQPGAGPGGLAMPTGIHIDSRDRIFVANTMNQRIEVFEYAKNQRDEK